MESSGPTIRDKLLAQCVSLSLRELVTELEADHPSNFQAVLAPNPKLCLNRQTVWAVYRTCLVPASVDWGSWKSLFARGVFCVHQPFGHCSRNSCEFNLIYVAVMSAAITFLLIRWGAFISTSTAISNGYPIPTSKIGP